MLVQLNENRVSFYISGAWGENDALHCCVLIQWYDDCTICQMQLNYPTIRTADSGLDCSWHKLPAGKNDFLLWASNIIDDKHDDNVFMTFPQKVLLLLWQI